MTQNPAPFIHSVYFWLKEPDNQKDRIAFEQSLKAFIHKSQFIKSKHFGIPASTNRGVIDHSYTYSLILSFANKADQDAYQEEPNHELFIQECARLWKKVLVYDSINMLS